MLYANPGLGGKNATTMGTPTCQGRVLKKNKQKKNSEEKSDL